MSNKPHIANFPNLVCTLRFKQTFPTDIRSLRLNPIPLSNSLQFLPRVRRFSQSKMPTENLVVADEVVVASSLEVIVVQPGLSVTQSAVDDVVDAKTDGSNVEAIEIDPSPVDELPSASADAIPSGRVAALTNGSEVGLVEPNADGGNGVIRTVQTQHGDFRKVDEENIVVLVRCHTPLPENEEQLQQGSVWIQEDEFGRDAVEVSFF